MSNYTHYTQIRRIQVWWKKPTKDNTGMTQVLNYFPKILKQPTYMHFKEHYKHVGCSVVKNPPAMQEALVWSLCQEDDLEEENRNSLQYSYL